MKTKYVSWDEIVKIVSSWPDGKYYGVPRGGMYIAALKDPVDCPEEAEYICDDIIDSGATRDLWKEKYPDHPFFSVIDIPGGDEKNWYVFPWEKSGDKIETIESNVKRLLQRFDDASREGLIDTPKRYVKFMEEFLCPPEVNYTTFNGERYDEMVIVKDIPFYSFCEHHIAPFFGTAAIAYIPSDRIVGISKLPRTLEYFARRFQNQERITKQVASKLMEVLKPKGVAVRLEARHMCMEMRGVKKPGSNTITSDLRGVFKTDSSARNEFIQLIK